MFDKLIETEPTGANIHNRRRYFMVSSFFVGLLFATAVVISIYAEDYGLGNDSFELSMVVAPPEIVAELALQRQQARSPVQSQLPSRPENMLNLHETPTIVPPTISAAPNSELARPISSNFRIDATSSDGGSPDGTGRNTTGTNSSDVGLTTDADPIEDTEDPEPPLTPKKPVDAKPTILRSTGPINGKATYLPKPSYPAAAVAINLQGKVDVQVLIDETGKVVSAKAVNGHPFFKTGAERAAWGAKFSPTYLNNVPVKVTGVIVYNFSR